MNDLGVYCMSGASYIISKFDNVEYCKSNGQFTKHLRNNNISYQQYFETYVLGYSPKCSCGVSLTFYQHTETYAGSCGDPVCVGKNVSKTKQSWTHEQRQQDSRNKIFAATQKTAEQVQAQVEKTKETFRKKYGVEWATQAADYKNKAKQTKKERYGNEYYNGNDKTSAAWQRKSDVDIRNIVEKRRATCLDRFGVENALMKTDAKTNSARSNSIGREFTLPSGRIIGIRGYEDTAISKLLEQYSEEDLVFDDRKTQYTLPIFKYVNVNVHTSIYFPDIHIPKENKIVEVKGRWWWDRNGAEKYKSRLYNNLRKKDAVLAAGYIYEVWLFESKTKYEILQWTQ